MPQHLLKVGVSGVLAVVLSVVLPTSGMCQDQSSADGAAVTQDAVKASTETAEKAGAGRPVELDADTRRRLKDVARVAYLAIYDGWSTDEVLLQDELNAKYLADCQRRMPGYRDFEFNWSLLNLRKAGELRDIRSTRRADNGSATQSDEWRHAAEIAARFIEDRYSVNTDRVICDTELRSKFDEHAGGIAPGVEPYYLRKAAFALRKSRRLSPELVLRVVDWKREVTAWSATELAGDSSLIPHQPGVYIFRDATGYLYIGESSDLRARVSKHLDQSDRLSLGHYLETEGIREITIELHAFDAESPARLKPHRRAYESELIRSRKPRFNLAP